MLAQLPTERYRLYRDYFTKLGVSVLLLHATAVVIPSLVVTVCTANFYTKDLAFCPHSMYAFHMIITINTHYSLYRIHRSVFLMEAHYVLRVIRN